MQMNDLIYKANAQEGWDAEVETETLARHGGMVCKWLQYSQNTNLTES